MIRLFSFIIISLLSGVGIGVGFSGDIKNALHSIVGGNTIATAIFWSIVVLIVLSIVLTIILKILKKKKKNV